MAEESHSGPAAGTAEEFDDTVAKFRAEGLDFADTDALFAISENELELGRCGSVELADLVKLKACLIASQMPESDTRVARELWRIFHALDDETLTELSYFMACGDRDSIRGLIRPLLATSQQSVAVKADRIDWNLIHANFDQETAIKFGLSSVVSAKRCCPKYPGKASTCCFAALLTKEKFKDKENGNKVNEEDIYNFLYEMDEDEVLVAIMDHARLLALVKPLYPLSFASVDDMKYEDPNGLVPFLMEYLAKVIEWYKRNPSKEDPAAEVRRTSAQSSHVGQYPESYSESIFGGPSEPTDNREKAMCAPYTVICQSSGYGKTRLALELRKHFFLIYTCIRDVRSSGEPARSYIASAFLKCQNIWQYARFYRAFFETFRRYLYTGKFGALLANLHVSISYMLSIESEGRDFWKAVDEQCNGPEADFSIAISCAGEAYKDIVKRLAEKGLDKPFIFVIDEARCMLSGRQGQEAFQDWRRTIAQFKYMDIFFVLLDTSSRVADFMPSLHDDTSFRSFSAGLNLFTPIYLLPTSGVVDNKVAGSPVVLLPARKSVIKTSDVSPMADEMEIPGPAAVGSASQQELMSSQDLQMELEYDPLEVFKTGRPLFARMLINYMNSYSWDRAFEELITLARLKLTYLGNLEKTERASVEMQYMAVLACRLSLRPIESVTCERLVSGFMATLVHIDEERTMISSIYPPEPVLQEAASWLLRPQKRFETSLRYLLAKVRFGQFEILASKGGLGELAASVVLLRAYDCLLTHHTDYFMTPRPLGDFVHALVGAESYREFSSKLPKGYVSFSKWIRIASPFDHNNRDVLLEAFKSRCAIVCKPNQTDIDLVIPYVLAREGQGRFQATLDDMCPILIQIKNFSSPWHKGQRQTARDGIAKISKPFPSSLVLLMQLGDGGIGAESEGISFLDGTSALPMTISIPSIKSLPKLTFSNVTKSYLEKIAGLRPRYSSLEDQYEPYSSVETISQYYDGVNHPLTINTGWDMELL